MTRCRACGALNTESSRVCKQCGTALDESLTALTDSATELQNAEQGAAGAPPPYRDRPDPHGFAPGQILARRYRIVSLLGRGGMGEVYRADDLKLGQAVALKFLPVAFAKNVDWREAFYAEVRMARQVSHPNVCRVYDIGESDGRIFLSMEFVDGEDLASLLRRIGRLPEDKAVEIAQQLCAGLAAAHTKGVLHRDLKPSNVMIDGKGHARITDFGLAIPAAESDRAFGAAGTPGYLAPELLGGKPPSVQSDLYGLGLVLYEIFTGKRAFEASSFTEFHRKQTEATPNPLSSVIRSVDPAVECAILRCLEKDASLRPRSALSVSAALPGGDPLSAALAAGETPSPELVAAAGPEGVLRLAIAWACFGAAITLILVGSALLARYATDWGLAPMEKSPEVLADRAQELARKLGYSAVVDRDSWLDSEPDYMNYVAREVPRKDWINRLARKAWPSTTSFWYRQSPEWMMPTTPGTDQSPAMVTNLDPAYEVSGMATIKLDLQGRLLFFRGVPPQIEPHGRSPEPNWSVLFTEAGLEMSRFSPASPRWTPPEGFDARADWEGHSTDQPELPLHIAAAAFHGVPVYFQVIAPWDKPGRIGGPNPLVPSTGVAAFSVVICLGPLVIGGFFALRNLRQGRGDHRGALRLAGFVALSFSLWMVLESAHHFVPRPGYIWEQFIVCLGFPLLGASVVGVGYLAVEPYARRRWPKVLVSWQRLLSGRLRDPLVGRELLLGTLLGALLMTVGMCRSVITLANGPELARPKPTSICEVSDFGRGILPTLGWEVSLLGVSPVFACVVLGVLSIITGVLPRRWLALLATGLILIVLIVTGYSVSIGHLPVLWKFLLGSLNLILFLVVLVRIGLVAAASMIFVFGILGNSPPLDINRWYAGRVMIVLLVPLTMLLYGFYTSIGKQSVFGHTLK